MVFVARLCSMMCLLLVNGCWVGRNAVSGLLVFVVLPVFVGGDSRLIVISWMLSVDTLAYL